MSLILSFLVLIGGLVLLIYSADKFVASAVAISRELGVSTLMIGLTIVSVGTSAPEILVSVEAALNGVPGIAYGNAIGSNIANIGLVLGMTAIVVPLPFALSVLKVEMPWMMLATLVVAVCLLHDFRLSYLDGVIFLVLLALGFHQMIRNAKKQKQDLTGELSEYEAMTRGKAIFWLILGLALLLIAARLIVASAENIAYALSVPHAVVGVTIVALGTSLPELAATLTAAVKKQTELAIGNVVGSNILNILAVLPVTAILHPTDIPPIEVWRDFGAMFAFTVLLALFAYGIRSKKVVTRFEGAILLIGYFGYLTLVAVQSA